MRILPFHLGLLALLPGAALSAQEPAGPVTPETAAGVFRTHCARCHGTEKPKGGVDLSSLEAAGRGGKHGPVVVPGRAEESRLWQLVRDDKMPPKKPLPAAERKILWQWIEQGAPGLGTRLKEAHWAFRPPVRPPVPAVRRVELARTPLDPFIEAELEKHGLALGAEADPATLLRRVSFDLTGLPPTPAEVEMFLADRSPGAYERMVERYLASPHYGERWGKFWLDAAGYADSNGHFSADSDRPLAYRYRDYVIRAFNADKPYDRFVCEQLAGDELAGFVPGGDVTRETADLLTATHFLRNAPDGTGESDGNPDEVRTDRFSVLEGNLQIVMSCLLGVTIQCARCHDHKFEPVRQEEYYRLQAILFPAYCPDRWVKPNDRVVEVGSRAQRERRALESARLQRQIDSLRDGLAAIAAPYRERLLEERLTGLDPDLRAAVLRAAAVPKDKQTKHQAELVKKYVQPFNITDDDLAKRFPDFAAVRRHVQQAIAEREKARPRPLERLAVLVETEPKPPAHHILIRGQHGAPGKEVQPGVPAALCAAGNEYRVVPLPPAPSPPRGEGRTVSSGRRLAFARWVTAAENPLFARVMVNRVWQHHFGVGLVGTPDNLGQSGARPSHPELLDYLATEFVRSGWSVKALHRLILRSAVYRQSSAFRDGAFARDPDNRLLWRYPLRRLDAEALRDAMLAAAGELDRRAGGPYVPTRRTPEGSVEVDERHDGARRRSVYLQQRRTQVATLLELFDAPALATNCTARNTSTVPLQALVLLNSEFARARAAGFARRLRAEAGPDADGRVARAFLLACGRQPRPEEITASRRFLAEQRALYAGDQGCDEKALRDFCQMVLASNAFLYVE